MDLLTFISSIIGSLVWPATIAIIIWTFRDPLSKRLRALSKFEYKDLTIDFRREMAELETAALNIQSSTPDDKKSNAKPTQLEKEIIPRSRDEDVAQVAQVSPSAAISVSWSMVERALLLAALRLALTPDGSPRSSASQNIRSLHDADAIDRETFGVLERMRQIRNKTVGGEYANADISTKDALEYHQLARDMVKKLGELHR